MRFGVRALCIILLGLLSAMPSLGDTAVSIDIGWSDRTRPGAWTPLFITVADPKPRNAVAELHAPHDARMAMKIDQPIAIGPSPQTYVIYAPLINSWGDPVSLKIRDVSNGKLLYDEPIFSQSDPDPRYANLFNTSGNSGPFIGISGRGPALAQLDTRAGLAPTLGFLSEPRLPSTAKEYDAIQALVLNQPNFSQLQVAQQTAIRDWVYAGGRLVLWPSEDPIPPGGPLIGLLPCGIGEVTTVTLSKQDLKEAGLADRFNKYKARVLTPLDKAVTIPLLGKSGAQAIRAARGLGSVTVVNFDAAGPDFITARDAEKFWAEVVDLLGEKNLIDAQQARVYQGNQIQDQRRAEAAGQIIDLLGDVPGVGAFGFKYVAMVLLGMMVIVGPVDWFVLKWMGRQPWTWVTTLGWIGLITTGAIFIGTVFRSGDLHYRTLQVIDQADDASVARTDVIGIYSPKNDEYRIDTPPGSWWEPISTDQYGYGGTAMQAIPFRQDGRANLPEEMTINVWNLRFLSGETIGRNEPVIAASLVMEPGTHRTTGSITNLGDSILTHLWLRTDYGTVDLTRVAGFPPGGLAPKATFQISATFKDSIPADYWDKAAQNNTPYRYGRYGSRSGEQAKDPLSIVHAASDLSTIRTHRISQLIKDHSTAAIYGLSEAAAQPLKLIEHDAFEKHWQVVRAVVSLKQ